uniref:(northern house mosquito) hypothetical protein n=1 Tax=Culex pipiens TaxID=7175 RepID=A0A8D8ANU7_CULPI
MWPRTDPGDAARHGHDVPGAPDAADVAAPLPVISSATSAGAASPAATGATPPPTSDGCGGTGNHCRGPVQPDPGHTDGVCVSLMWRRRRQRSGDTLQRQASGTLFFFLNYHYYPYHAVVTRQSVVCTRT